ncbi:MAG: hypothetical protein AAFP17_07220 [Pseudomonadota bacterium]
MTDATMMPAEPTTKRSFSARLTRELREAMAVIAGLPERLAAARATYRAERDFDRIHDALNTLNKRQLAMLGLKRDEIYSFTDVCVHQPERRPELQLEQADKPLALEAPAAAAAITEESASAPEPTHAPVSDTEVEAKATTPLVDEMIDDANGKAGAQACAAKAPSGDRVAA